jgi:hypothetical protein
MTVYGARWMQFPVQKLMSPRVPCVIVTMLDLRLRSFFLFEVPAADPPPPTLAEPQPKLSFSLLDGTFDENERFVVLLGDTACCPILILFFLRLFMQRLILR